MKKYCTTGDPTTDLTLGHGVLVSHAAVGVRRYAMIIMSLREWTPSMHVHAWLIDKRGIIPLCLISAVWGFSQQLTGFSFVRMRILNPLEGCRVPDFIHLLWLSYTVAVVSCQDLECKCRAAWNSYSVTFMTPILFHSVVAPQTTRGGEIVYYTVILPNVKVIAHMS